MNDFLLNHLFILFGIWFIWYLYKNNNTSKITLDRGKRFIGLLLALGLIIVGIIGFLDYYKVW